MTEDADPLAKGWYYRKHGKPHGPVARERLQAMIESRELLADAEVWHPSLVGWQVAARHFKMPRPKPAPEPQPPVPAKPRDLARYELGRDLDRPQPSDAEVVRAERRAGRSGPGVGASVGLALLVAVALVLVWSLLPRSSPPPQAEPATPAPTLSTPAPAVQATAPAAPAPALLSHPAPSPELAELLRLIAGPEPELHRQLLAALFPEAGPDGRVPESIGEAEARLGIVAALAARASDDVVLRWLDARLEQLRFLRDDRLFADCVKLLAGRDAVPAVHPSLRQREHEAIARMLADARGRQPARVDRVQAENDHLELEALAERFRAERFGDVEQPTEAERQQFDCRTATEYHDRWLRLPTARAANLLRARGPVPGIAAAGS